MDEMCQDLGMPGYLKNAGKLIRSVEALKISLARKRMVRLAERNCCGAGRHRKSLDLGVRYFQK
jgi:hypothetical protein